MLLDWPGDPQQHRHISTVGLAAECAGTSLPRVQLKADASPLAHFPYVLTDSPLSSGTLWDQWLAHIKVLLDSKESLISAKAHFPSRFELGWGVFLCVT